MPDARAMVAKMLADEPRSSGESAALPLLEFLPRALSPAYGLGGLIGGGNADSVYSAGLVSLSHLKMPELARTIAGNGCWTFGIASCEREDPRVRPEAVRNRLEDQLRIDRGRRARGKTHE